MLHLVLPYHDILQVLHRRLPAPTYCRPNPSLDHQHCDGDYGPHWHRFLLRHPTTVPSHKLLLVQGSRGNLSSFGGHCCPYILVQCFQRHLRFHLRYPSNVLNPRPPNGPEDQIRPGSYSLPGLRVSLEFSGALPCLTVSLLTSIPERALPLRFDLHTLKTSTTPTSYVRYAPTCV